MKNFYIISNTTKDEDLKVTRQVSDYLSGRGACVLREPTDQMECVITIGGDGTIIQAARSFADRNVAFVGVNLGTLGFLAEIQLDDLNKNLDRLISDDFDTEDRMMICGEIDNLNKSYLALNDIVVYRSGHLQVIEYKILVNGRVLTTYRADGVIISTPTGSSGYSLSAGGPYVEPGSSIMEISAISAHTLNNRSIILSGNNTIEIIPSWSRDGAKVVVAFDGQENIELKSGQKVSITNSDKTTKFIRLNEESFVTALAKKL